MANITVRDAFKNTIPEEVAQKLTPSEIEVVKASLAANNNPKISSLSGELVERLVSTIILKCSTRLGLKPKEDVNEQIALQRELNKDVLKFPNATATEILTGLENGLDGKYTKKDQPVIFNPSNFVQWIKSYMEEIKPVKAKLAQLNHQHIEEIPVPSEYETLVSRFKILCDACIDMKETGKTYQDFGATVYSLLTQFEYIKPVLADSIEMKRAATKVLDEAKSTANSHQIKKVAEIYDKVWGGQMEDSVFAVATRSVVAAKMKDICLGEEDDILDFLANVKEKIKDYIDEKNLKP